MRASDKPKLAGRQPSNRGGVPLVRTWSGAQGAGQARASVKAPGPGGSTMTLAITPEDTATAVPAVVGSDLRVPLVTGERVTYANLDHAASAPCLREVRDAVDELLPWYASVHRGAGFASQVSTRVYEQARDRVRRFTGARSSDAVVFTRNTTDALNLLARSVPKGTAVVLFDSEHHAALLPWRGPNVQRIATPS